MQTHKQQIINTLQKETDICKRLFTHIPDTMRDYSPGYEMRTTLELLQYLTWNAISCVENFIETELELRKKIYAKYSDYGDTMKWVEFPQRMDEQMAKINEMLGNVTDEELLTREVQLPWRAQMLLGEALLETAVKWMTGYKMQLYLYMKMNGVELHTGDCWITTE